MATYGQIEDDIATLLARSGINSDIRSAILGAIKFYENEPFWFNEDTFKKTLSSSQSLYTLTGSLSLITSILNAKITYNGTEYPLRAEQQQELDRIDATTSYELPSRYAIWGNQIRTYPTPNSAYTVTFRAYRKYTTLSASTDTNAWTVNAEELIKARAMWWLGMTRLRNPTLAQASKEIEMQALTTLRRKTNNLTATGKTTPTSF